MTVQTDLRRRREAIGLTQEELGRRVNASRQTVAKIERGENEPKVLLAIAIAAVFGVAVTEIFRKGAIRI